MAAEECSKNTLDGLSVVRELLPQGIEDLVEDNTILVQRTLRSGQSVYHDGNIVLLGDVNPGSELVATGNIIVLGALRGVVHAGAAGDEKAIIIAFKLQPTQLRIADHITRAPDGEDFSSEQPEVARIKGGIVTIEAFQNSGERQRKGS
ncbi:septum site-determining protein MinC [Desulfolucanica intricata]|uniref:septum site-determining protein MinC n=1 Tax=Desulfolucanica intricata TaxID=1285191 RepID=UPI0008316018|nr:septum site-determining protein MinC [Desulfolucanica intricata]